MAENYNPITTKASNQETDKKKIKKKNNEYQLIFAFSKTLLKQILFFNSLTEFVESTL